MNSWQQNSCVFTPARAQCGFTLLEVLVALAVVSIGLLGLAKLQITGLKSNQSANYLSQAMAQAYDMADRMRANMAGYKAGSYDNITGIPADPGCITSGCSSAQMAQYDTFQWNTANRTLLPSGKGTVTVSGNIRIITVMWDEQRTGATGTACSGNPQVDLTCFQTSFQP